MSYFTYLCIQLQKCFRGYYSRKYKHDQVRRKQYCKMLIEQGELVRQNLQKYAEELAEVNRFLLVECAWKCVSSDALHAPCSSQREEIDKEQKKDAEFKRLAENLHHLVSTKRIPGVYKPIPYCNNVRSVHSHSLSCTPISVPSSQYPLIAHDRCQQ